MDHVKDYRPPKDSEDIDDVTKILREEGCAPRAAAPPPSSSSDENEQNAIPAKKLKKGEVAPIFMRKDRLHHILLCPLLYNFMY